MYADGVNTGGHLIPPVSIEGSNALLTESPSLRILSKRRTGPLANKPLCAGTSRYATSPPNHKFRGLVILDTIDRAGISAKERISFSGPAADMLCTPRNFRKSTQISPRFNQLRAGGDMGIHHQQVLPAEDTAFPG